MHLAYKLSWLVNQFAPVDVYGSASWYQDRVNSGLYTARKSEEGRTDYSNTSEVRICEKRRRVPSVTNHLRLIVRLDGFFDEIRSGMRTFISYAATGAMGWRHGPWREINDRGLITVAIERKQMAISISHPTFFFS